MEQQHGHVGDTHVLGEGGRDNKVPMVRSVSHQDHLGKVYSPDSCLEKHHTRSSENVAGLQDSVIDGFSRDNSGGERELKDESSRNLVSSRLQNRYEKSENRSGVCASCALGPEH